MYLALTAAGALQVGTSWDESEHRRYGELVLDFYASAGDDREAVTDRMGYYGGLHAVAGAIAERLLPFLNWSLARHFAAVAFGLIGFVYCVRLARLLGGSRAGLMAALLLAATPRWTGDAMYNPIDIPVAGPYAAALFYLARIACSLPRPALRDWILFGVTTGSTLAVRTAGVFPWLQALLVIAAWGLFVPRPRRDSWRVHGARILVGFVLSTALALAVACAFWPRLLVEPASLADSFRLTKSFPWNRSVLFRGASVSARELPPTYLPVWFAITTPIATITGLVLAVVFRRRWLPIMRESQLVVVPLAFAILLPPAGAVLLGATLYDGIRHFLFILPPVTSLAALGWNSAFRAAAELRRGLGLSLLLALAAAVAEPAVWYVRSHPYEYVYFNPLAGGLDQASHAYDTEYWGISLRSAAEWLEEFRIRELGPQRELVVGTNAPWHLIEPWLADPAMVRYVKVYTTSEIARKRFDVLLLNSRFHTFRLRDPIKPIETMSLVDGQVPFWLIYMHPRLGLPLGTAPR